MKNRKIKKNLFSKYNKVSAQMSAKNDKISQLHIRLENQKKRIRLIMLYIEQLVDTVCIKVIDQP